MFKVGKHEFIVRAPKEVYDRETCEYFEDDDNETGEPEYMYYTTVSDIRVEEIHPFVKNRLSKQTVRYFDKEKSVFAPWKGDTAKTIESAF